MRAAIALAAAIAIESGCTAVDSGDRSRRGESGPEATISVIGSDTMVNLVQAWAEAYKKARPGTAVLVSGGGTGVGLAALADGLVDIASASREMKPEEDARAAAGGVRPPGRVTVAFDALAIYVHRDNPLEAIALAQLAEIYGEGGRLERWSQLGVDHRACRSDKIIRIARQNNSGTYAYFREAVLGPRREYRLGSVDQSGSKDVVALVSTTPCAIGYSGIAYATPAVRVLDLVGRGRRVAPSAASVIDGSYPLARALYFYTRGQPTSEVNAFVDWVLSPAGQTIVRDLGFVPAAAPDT